MSDKKECFIIMPITTPEPMIKEYRDGEEHFKHVLECLFKPAIEKAGYIPKPPIAEGSDLIHAEIIKNLETADIILCDMSSLNPNVFFEFGIRTSLNKPVCIVKDELTKSVPFDPGILNHHEYKSSLEPWELETEIKKLSDHLGKSSERSKGVNTLWKYFGFKSEAEPYKVAEGAEGKLDYLAMQMDILQKKMDESTLKPKPTKRGVSNLEFALDIFWPKGSDILEVNERKDSISVVYTGAGEMREKDREELVENITKSLGKKLILKYYRD